MERHSFWRRQLHQARQTNDWFTVERQYTKKTALQTAIDIRRGARIAGIKPTEQWDANVILPENADIAIGWRLAIRRQINGLV
jgi:hypothetical protein